MFSQLFFMFSALLTVGGALAVLASKQIMHACVYLLCSLIGVAGLYVTLGADFVAATQLVVYVGGVVILMLFAVMLTGGEEDKVNKLGLEKIPSMGNTKTYIIGFLTSLVFLWSVFKLISGVVSTRGSATLDPIEPTVSNIGMLLISDHVLAFEISSVLLLGALVGAAVIARPAKES